MKLLSAMLCVIVLALTLTVSSFAKPGGNSDSYPSTVAVQVVSGYATITVDWNKGKIPKGYVIDEYCDDGAAGAFYTSVAQWNGRSATVTYPTGTPGSSCEALLSDETNHGVYGIAYFTSE